MGLYTNATDLLVLLPPTQNPRGDFMRLMLWKDYDKPPPTSGALPQPADSDDNTKLNDSSLHTEIGEDHVAPLAGYYNRSSIASETLWFTSASLKLWQQQPRPRPPLGWTRRYLQNRYDNQSSHSSQMLEVHSSGSVISESVNKNNYAGIVKSQRISIDCEPGLSSMKNAPRQTTDALAAKLWYRIHAKCWNLVGPMLNFSRHTSAIGQPWTIAMAQNIKTSEDKNDKSSKTAAIGFVSAEYMLVVDAICQAANKPPYFVDILAFEQIIQKSFSIEQGLTYLGLCLLHDRFGNRVAAAHYCHEVAHTLPTETFDPTFEWAGLVHLVRPLALIDHDRSAQALEIMKEMNAHPEFEGEHDIPLYYRLDDDFAIMEVLLHIIHGSPKFAIRKLVKLLAFLRRPTKVSHGNRTRRNFTDDANDDRELLTTVDRHGYGQCLQRGLEFLSEWILDLLERASHKPVTNRLAFETVAKLRNGQRHRRLTSLGAQTGQHKEEILSVTWSELEDIEATVSVAGLGVPSLIKVDDFDGSNNNISNQCHKHIGVDGHPLQYWAASICNWNAAHMCMHIGHENIHLRRSFPFIDRLDNKAMEKLHHSQWYKTTNTAAHDTHRVNISSATFRSETSFCTFARDFFTASVNREKQKFPKSTDSKIQHESFKISTSLMFQSSLGCDCAIDDYSSASSLNFEATSTPSQVSNLSITVGFPLNRLPKVNAAEAVGLFLSETVGFDSTQTNAEKTVLGGLIAAINRHAAGASRLHVSLEMVKASVDHPDRHFRGANPRHRLIFLVSGSQKWRLHRTQQAETCGKGLGYVSNISADASETGKIQEPEEQWNCGCTVRDLRSSSSSRTLRAVFAELAKWHEFPGLFPSVTDSLQSSDPSDNSRYIHTIDVQLKPGDTLLLPPRWAAEVSSAENAMVLVMDLLDY